jgi:hypothetical protein
LKVILDVATATEDSPQRCRPVERKLEQMYWWDGEPKMDEPLKKNN